MRTQTALKTVTTRHLVLTLTADEANLLQKLTGSMSREGIETAIKASYGDAVALTGDVDALNLELYLAASDFLNEEGDSEEE
jgi:hypothetical protein